MPKSLGPSHQYRYTCVSVLVLLMFVLAFVNSCADAPSETSPAAGAAPPAEAGSAGGVFTYDGETSIEERIAGSDAIVRVRLRSVSPAAYPQIGGLEYLSALAHRFQALEYLKGNGGGELVAVVYDYRRHNILQNATAHANALLAERDAQWDGREAIVFLRNDPRQDNHYVLGAAYTGVDNPFDKDYYSIASDHSKNWLPAASPGGLRSSDGDNQIFLLGVPPGLGRSGRSVGTTPTITKGDLKARIAAIEEEVAAGDGSEAYRDCVYEKYKWEREVRFYKEAMGGVYFYRRYDEAISSGLPC